MKKERQKHNYTSEIELKSLLIRVKNKKLNVTEDETHNSKINRYIKLFNKINEKEYTQDNIKRKNIVKAKVKTKIIELSEKTKVDDVSYERFGAIILLMIKRILTKTQFSGYTYKDDFYSDAIHKILKYLHNFDHTMISVISDTYVNSFAYISQIIHNSVLCVLNTKKKEQVHIQKQISMDIVDHNYNIKNFKEVKESTYTDEHCVIYSETFKTLKANELLVIVKKLSENSEDKIELKIPSNYVISIDEYSELKQYLNGKFTITRTHE